ncbi:hypothetical protein [Chryseobacterium sp. MMS23-Vi53]|uniref:hypothetical protein n=1 Tax=Chryseobacterium sp. MMS23-Vi53 TaxID=3386644 RepID=UPI0039ECCC9E
MSKKEILRRLNTLRIKPSGLQQRKYGVSVKYFSGNEQTPSKRIDYEVTTDLNIDDYKGILTINKENIFYNQHEAEGISEILNNSISNALYPLQTHLNEKGLSTNEIFNIEEIKKRWKNEKSKLLENYSSVALDEFFNAIDKKIEDISGLEKGLQNDWFWNLFFHPKFINYGETRKAKAALFLSIIPYQPAVRFPGIQTINKIPTDYHSFVIDFQSEELHADYYFIRNISGKTDYFMSLKVIFDLDVYHHFPMHIRVYFEVYSKDLNGNKNFIKKINYTQYQQNTEEFKHKKLDKSSPFITGGLVVSEPNKWGFYKNEYENDW